MPVHQFTLIVEGPDLQDDALIDRLFEAGCDDAAAGRIDGVQYVDFDREAASYDEAVLSAVADIERIGGVQVIRIAAAGLVSTADIARRTGRTPESVRRWVTGARGPGGFPAPVTEPRNRSRLWRWSDVARWRALQLGEALDSNDHLAMAINAGLSLRRYRGELTPAGRTRLSGLAGLSPGSDVSSPPERAPASSARHEGGMRVRIHRGTKEIGGTCIEIEAQGRRIALDVGLPLDAPQDEKFQKSLLPEVPGFRDADDTLLAVLVSHPHMDHYGLARHVRPGVPVYVGEDAHRIMRAASPWVPNGYAFDQPSFLHHEEQVQIGPFRITPYLVDHSAFDAYSLLVEADGKRIFYSGDFRARGRKPRLFKKMIRHPPANIDVLLMEGTTIGRAHTTEGFPTEWDLEREFIRVFQETEGIHFVWASAQNIDRMVTIFRAAKQTGRVLIVDLYAAVVLEATGNARIPQSHWPEVMVYVPQPQRVQIKNAGLFADRDRHHRQRIYREQLSGLSNRAVMLFRPMMMHDRDVQAVTEGARLSYSMWSGYLEEESTQKALAWLDARGVPWEAIHTSGHASVADLKRFARALAPRKLVPIHSFQTRRFGEFFDNVVQEDDGTWWAV